MTFNILTIGDSVMWGQGNLERDKFSCLVKERISSDLNQTVKIFNYAHSGAPLVTRTFKNAKQISLDDIQGEIPKLSPSVGDQLSASIKDLNCDAIDLILLNGGANDLGIADVSNNNPLLNLLLDKKQFVGDIEDKCYVEMRNIANIAINNFPNAKLVIVGYYPIIAAFSKGVNIITTLLPIPHSATRAMFIMLNHRSVVWKNETNKAFSRVVNEMNQRKPNVAAFAKSNIKSRNACFVTFPRSNWLWEFTPKSHKTITKNKSEYTLYDLNSNEPIELSENLSGTTFNLAGFIANGVANDNVAKERINFSINDQTREQYRLTDGIASFSHPNTLGCISISQSIILELQGLGLIERQSNKKLKNAKEKIRGTVKSLKASIRKLFHRGR